MSLADLPARSVIVALPLLVGLLSARGGEAAGAEPSGSSEKRDPVQVARAIDREIRRRLDAAKVRPSPPADDAELLRRVTLDITGRIPSPEQTAAFLDSTDPEKRRKLIDDLLAGPLHGDYFAGIWTGRILARGTPPQSMRSTFHKWLADQLRGGRGWDGIVHEMLTASGTPSDSPASYFVRASLQEPGQLAAATSQLFLGVDIQCAECHDHPTARWEQADYWGMAVFFSRLRQVRVKGGQRVSEETPPGKKPVGPAITIPTAGGNKGAGKVVKARLLTGEQPTLPEGGPFRPTLADWIVAKDNPYFGPATVNRMWGHFFGAGFVNPVDDFTEHVPPSHPELLKMLSAELAASGYDLKHLIRCICNSEAYQRSSRVPPGGAEDNQLFGRMAVKVLPPDVLFDSLVVAMGNPRLPGGLGLPLPYELYAGGPARSARVNPRDEFIKFFASGDDPGVTTEYTHGIPQVLALMNAGQLNQVPPVVEGLVKAGVSREKAVESLFLAALARRPAAGEVKLMTAYLAGRKDAREGYAGVLWILLNSSEFLLNH